jgi:SIR2-like domain
VFRNLEPPLAIVLGAGWSAALGLPLAAQLFDPPVLVASKESEQRMRETIAAYRGWLAANPDGHPEQFLDDVKASKVNRLPRETDQLGLFPPPPEELPWDWAVELVGLRLATALLQGRVRCDDEVAMASGSDQILLRYSHGFRPIGENDIHRRFWASLFRVASITGVITTNYDLTIEQSLGRWPRRQVPGFHYGGFGKPQLAIGGDIDWGSRLRGTGPRATGEDLRRIAIKGQVPLFKLHGSLNWALSEHGLRFYEDARPVFKEGGIAAIVPPLPEKEPPPWLKAVWHGAGHALAAAQTWLIVGYSLPPYDHALQELLQRAAAEGPHPDIRLIDPRARDLIDRWQNISPGSAISTHPGLGVETARERIEAAYRHVAALPSDGRRAARRAWRRRFWWVSARGRDRHRAHKELRRDLGLPDNRNK